MNEKILCSDRIRKISGSFAFIEHRFLREGFFGSLSDDELKLYLFLVLVANQKGISWYGYDKICSQLQFLLEEYIDARNGLIDKDLIAFDGRVFQVLSLPPKPRFSKDGIPHRDCRKDSQLIPVSEIFKNLLNRPTDKREQRRKV